MRRFEEMTAAAMKDSSMIEEKKLTCSQYTDKSFSVVQQLLILLFKHFKLATMNFLMN